MSFFPRVEMWMLPFAVGFAACIASLTLFVPFRKWVKLLTDQDMDLAESYGVVFSMTCLGYGVGLFLAAGLEGGLNRPITAVVLSGVITFLVLVAGVAKRFETSALNSVKLAAAVFVLGGVGMGLVTVALAQLPIF